MATRQIKRERQKQNNLQYIPESVTIREIIKYTSQQLNVQQESDAKNTLIYVIYVRYVCMYICVYRHNLYIQTHRMYRQNTYVNI